MRKLYYKKGGIEECFNGPNLLLTKDDLLELKSIKKLPKTIEFFFGEAHRRNTNVI